MYIYKTLWKTTKSTEKFDGVHNIIRFLIDCKISNNCVVHILMPTSRFAVAVCFKKSFVFVTLHESVRSHEEISSVVSEADINRRDK